MANLSAWPPERLRALDRAVALVRGMTKQEVVDWDAAMVDLPPVSLGCRMTFVLQEEARIEVGWGGAWRAWYALAGTGPGNGWRDAPTPAIAICLAYLAAKGVKFDG